MSAEYLKRLSKPQRDYIRRIYPLGYSIQAIARSLGVRVARVRAYLERAPRLQLRAPSPPQASLPPLQAFKPRPHCGKRQVDEQGNPWPKVRPEEWWNAPIVPGWRVHGEVSESAKPLMRRQNVVELAEQPGAGHTRAAPDHSPRSSANHG